MCIYGYCRISRRSQSIERQERNILAAYPEAKIIKEVFTGTKVDGRKEFEKLLKIIRSGDTIIFDSVSRMSRNADLGVALYEDLFNKDVNLVFLNEPQINTKLYKEALNNQIRIRMETGNNATDNLMNTIIEALNTFTIDLAKEQVRLAFWQSEKEVEDLHKRTSQGMLTAKLNGKRIGNEKGAKLTTKKSLTAKEIIMKHSKDFNGSLTDEEVRKLASVSRNTFYKYKRELREAAE